MDIQELISYLQELRGNNNKTWFDSNRARYDSLREQFQNLVGDVIAQASRFDSSLSEATPESAMFRINRDIRFSKDKAPYKVAFSAMLVPGRKTMSQAGYYFMIHADDELIVGAGIHDPLAEQLASLRSAIAEHGKKLQDVVDDPTFHAIFHKIEGEQLKSVPRGFPADHSYADFLKHKSMTVGTTEKASVLEPDHLASHIASTFEAAFPFISVIREFADQTADNISK